VRAQAPTPEVHDAPVARHTPPQLVCPDGHVGTQVPPTQATDPPTGAVQEFPQAPQWFTSVWRFTSQPSDATPLQFAKGVLQVKPQVPAMQVSVAFARAGQVDGAGISSMLPLQLLSWLSQVSEAGCT
jgi:hypothetical protein